MRGTLAAIFTMCKMASPPKVRYGIYVFWVVVGAVHAGSCRT